MDKSTFLNLIILIVFLIYIYKTSKMYKTIQKSIILSDRGKLIHSIMIWLIPFWWYALFKDLIEHKSRTMTKRRRGKLSKGKGSFYESRKSFHG